jgi:hypothetical protein
MKIDWMTLARYALVIGSAAYLFMDGKLSYEVAWGIVAGILFPLTATKEGIAAMAGATLKRK